MIGPAFRLLILWHGLLLVRHALTGPDTGLIGFLVSGTLLLVTVADASDGLTHYNGLSKKAAAGWNRRRFC